MKVLSFLKKLDWVLIVTVFLIVSFGCLSLYSSSLGKGNFTNFKKQLFFFATGILLFFFISSLDWRIFRENSFFILIIYFLFLLGLLALLFFAPQIRGIKKWFKIGIFSLDLIEFLKILILILLAKYFSVKHIEMYHVKHLLLSSFYIFLPAVLAFFQPDLASILILVSLWIGILLLSGIKIRHLLVLFLFFILLFALGWQFFLREYQKERIIAFIAPQLVDPLGPGWSQLQSKIAIGSGGFFGKGLGKGSQTQYGFLPEPQTDFIFAAIAEEFGLLGVMILFFLFLILFWRIINVAISARSNFPRLFVSGFSILLIVQIFIHVGMNIGILPIIGVPLPLISYGGSNLLTIFFGLGIVQSIKINP
jgi:rod shape determining protein RodA